MKKSSILSYFKAGDIITVLLAVALAMFLTYSHRSVDYTDKPRRLYLYNNADQIPLSWQNATFSIYDLTGRQMIVEVDSGKARVVSSSCPDKVCVHTSWVENCGDVAACLPNGIALMVTCEDNINVTQ